MAQAADTMDIPLDLEDFFENGTGLGAEMETRYEPEGLRWRLAMPLAPADFAGEGT